jgi:hypothetical protein
MANTLTKGYTFGATELVTNAKLHALVDNGTATIDTAAVSATSANTFSVGDGAAGNKQISANNGDANLPNIRFNDTSNKWEYSNNGTTWIEMGSVSITSEPASNNSYSGTNIALTLSSIPMNFGDVGYLTSTGNVQFAKSTAIANANGIVMAVASNPAMSSGTFLLNGIARNDTWNWTVGSAIYLATAGTTGATLTQTAPVATDSVTQILGYATNADRVFFSPNSVQIEHV